MGSYRLEVIGQTDVGRVRTTNEDSVAVDGDAGFAFVLDGMGGHRGGEMASRMAHDALLSRVRRQLVKYRTGIGRPPLEFIPHIVDEANQAIHAAAQRDTSYQGMGTTLALALFHGEHVTLAHVGDSRVYRLRDGRLKLMTRDDSLLRDQVDMGLITKDDAGGSHNRHLVTAALGIHPRIAAHLHEEEVKSGDVYLLCSDGLNDMVEDADIELIVNALQANLPLAASHLIQLANDNGGHDNISVALVKLCPAAQGSWLATWIRRLLGR
jgi:PPM family protein phosphatase